MSVGKPRVIRIAVSEGRQVSGLLHVPRRAWAAFAFAHGAGAGMTHPFMTAMAEGLAERGIATLRYQFLAMEQGVKRPDPPQVAHAVVRAALGEAAGRMPGLPLFAGGKSFGGRMTSQAQALDPLPHVRGLVFLGFPLHPPGAPSSARAAHLFETRLPLLFLQGTRDKLADRRRLKALRRKLGPRATLALFQEADHAFHVPARSGKTDAEVRRELLEAMAEWMKTTK